MICVIYSALWVPGVVYFSRRCKAVLKTCNFSCSPPEAILSSSSDKKWTVRFMIHSEEQKTCPNYEVFDSILVLIG